MAINNTVIAYSRVSWDSHFVPTIMVLFDGGQCTATTYPEGALNLPTDGQNIYNIIDITADMYNTAANNTYAGSFSASSDYNTNRPIRYLELGNQNIAPFPPPVSGHRTFSYELADEPGVTHTITVWVPGENTLRDTLGNLPTQAHQLRGVAWNFQDYIDSYDAALPGHNFQGEINVFRQDLIYASLITEHSDQTEGFNFMVQEVSDPDNRFYGETNFAEIGLITGTVPINFDTVDFVNQYVTDGTLNGPTTADCTFPNPATGTTSLRGIVSYDKYWHYTAAVLGSNVFSSSLYDEFVFRMGYADIHSTVLPPMGPGYVIGQTITGSSTPIEVVPTLGGWAINSHQVSTSIPIATGCPDLLAENYDPTATHDCNQIIGGSNDGCCWYCMDPNATNFHSGGLFNCDGTQVGTTATGWDNCCQYTAPVSGCTDPSATNFDPLATIDNGTCIYNAAPGNCEYTWSEECDLLGTADVTLGMGADLKNITTTYNGIPSIQAGCTSTGSVVLPLITTPGGTIEVEGECSFTVTDTFDPDITAILGGGVNPVPPPWAQSSCGETITTTTTVTFAADTDVYIWYDVSSWGADNVIDAYLAVRAWLDLQASTNNWIGNEYHIISINEKFIDWAAYPMTGAMMYQSVDNSGSMYPDKGQTPGILNSTCAGCPNPCTHSVSTVMGKTSNYAKCSAWIIENNVPNFYHMVANKLNSGASGTISVNRDIAGNAIAANVPVEQVNIASCAAHNGVLGSATYTGPSAYAGLDSNQNNGCMPPPVASGGNFLNIILLDEATDYNTSSTLDVGRGVAYGNPPGTGGYTTASTTNQSTNSTFKQEMQVKPQYMLHYDAFVTTWKNWTGSARTFLYPTSPGYSFTNQHYGSPLLFAAMVLSGNKPTPDGHFLVGTATTLHPIWSSSSVGAMFFFEDQSVTNAGTRNNCFWDKVNSRHPDYGYGGLDNYGWGVNVAFFDTGFTLADFTADLSSFITSGPPIVTTTTTVTCDDSECVLFIVKDQNNNFLSGYELTLNSASIGTTNSSGELNHTFTLASTLANQLVNNCWTVDPTGDCFQKRIELIVAKDSYTTNITCIGGCTDPLALNYDPLATWDDGSCIYCVWGCMDPTALNYNPLASCDDCTCIIEGCTNIWGLNYNSLATIDDGSCEFPGDDNDCVPDNIYYDVVNAKNCIAQFSTRYYKKLTTGMDDDCSTLMIWQLILISYFLEKFELDCIYNCADQGTPDASSENQGGYSTDTTNYLDKFRTFVAMNCENCFPDPVAGPPCETDITGATGSSGLRTGGNDDGKSREG